MKERRWWHKVRWAGLVLGVPLFFVGGIIAQVTPGDPFGVVFAMSGAGLSIWGLSPAWFG